jgi:hypothetical protein
MDPIYPNEILPPAAEEYALARVAYSNKDYAPLISYYTRWREYCLAMMKDCVIEKVIERYVKAKNIAKVMGRVDAQECAELDRAKYRKMAAQAEFNLGGIAETMSDGRKAAGHYEQAINHDPTVQQYRDALIRAMTKNMQRKNT